MKINRTCTCAQCQRQRERKKKKKKKKGAEKEQYITAKERREGGKGKGGYRITRCKRVGGLGRWLKQKEGYLSCCPDASPGIGRFAGAAFPPGKGTWMMVYYRYTYIQELLYIQSYLMQRRDLLASRYPSWLKAKGEKKSPGYHRMQDSTLVVKKAL